MTPVPRTDCPVAREAMADDFAAVPAAVRPPGIRKVDDGIWLVSFMHYDLEYFDPERSTLQPIDDPLDTKLSPMSQVQSVTHVSGSPPVVMAGHARPI
jgi:hypothetical protein